MIVCEYDNMLVDTYQPRINGNPIWNHHTATKLVGID